MLFQKTPIARGMAGMGLTAQEHADIENAKFGQNIWTADNALMLAMSKADDIDAMNGEYTALNAQRLATSDPAEKAAILAQQNALKDRQNALIGVQTQSAIAGVNQAIGFSPAEKQAASQALTADFASLVDYSNASSQFQAAADVYMTTPKTADSVQTYRDASVQALQSEQRGGIAADNTAAAITGLSDKVATLVEEQRQKTQAIINAHAVTIADTHSIATAPAVHELHVATMPQLQTAHIVASQQAQGISLPMIGIGLLALLALRG
jgi:hypothetical protein